MVLFSVFICYPVLQALVFAFQKVDLRGSILGGAEELPGPGASKLFWDTMRHTLVYAVFVVAAWITSSLIVAALIQPLSNRIQSLFRGAFYLPNVISIVIISLVWIWIFEPDYGFFNFLLGLVGIPRVLWLQNPDIALWSIVLSTVLIVPGTGVVLYSAAIGAIPRELYEAAEVEGANAVQKWFSITIPLLKPTTLYLMVIYTIAGFQIFERVYIMTGGGPINSTMTIVQLIFQTAFSDFNLRAGQRRGADPLCHHRHLFLHPVQVPQHRRGVLGHVQLSSRASGCVAAVSRHSGRLLQRRSFRRQSAQRRRRNLHHGILFRVPACGVQQPVQFPHFGPGLPVRPLATLRLGIHPSRDTSPVESLRHVRHAVCSHHAISGLLPNQSPADIHPIPSDLCLERPAPALDRRDLRVPFGPTLPPWDGRRPGGGRIVHALWLPGGMVGPSTHQCGGVAARNDLPGRAARAGIHHTRPYQDGGLACPGNRHPVHRRPH